MSQAINLSHTGIYGVVMSVKGEILLIQKARGPFTGLLDLPGGSPQWDESLEETLARELLEETGLQMQDCSQLITFLNILQVDKGSLRHIGIIYKATVKFSESIKTSPDQEDSLGAIWLPISQISENNCTPFVNWLLQRGLI